MSDQFPTYQNPIYSRLSEHVLFEYELSKKKHDIESQLFTLLADFVFDKQRVRNDLNDLLDESYFNKIDSLSKIKELALLFNISPKYDIKLSSELESNLSYLLKDLNSSVHYPIVSKSLVCWILKETENFSSCINDLQSQLRQKSLELLDEYKYLEAIEVAFGCTDSNCLDKIKENPIQFNQHTSGWPSDKLAKAIIRLSPCTDFHLEQLVDKLERKLHDDYSSWIEPDIWLAVIESEKIINSNMEQEEINNLLHNLKSSKNSWASIVDNIENEGVHIKLSSIIKSPAFSPVEDTLSILALNIAGRSETVQLTEKKFRELNKFTSDIEKTPLSPKEIILYAIGLLALTALAGYLLVQVLDKFSSINEFFNVVKTYDYSNFVALIMDIFLNPIIGFGFVLWWIVKLMLYPIDKKEFSVKALFSSIPLISYVKKLFQND